MKTCTKCGRGEPGVQFGKNKNEKSGIDFRCKPCRAEASRKWRADNIEKSRDNVKKWKEANPEWTKSYNKVYYAANADYHQARYEADKVNRNKKSIEWQRANPAKVKNHKMRTKYGIDVAGYEAMVAAQGGLCMICKRPPAAMKDAPGKLCVDHNHSTGAVRGLLCDWCNKGIGYFKESPEIIARAIAYVEKFSAAKTPNPSESHS